MTETCIQILHLEDDVVDSALISKTLEANGIACSLRRVDTKEEFCEQLEQGGFDVILADYTLPNFDGFSALELATASRPEVPFIFVSGTLDEEVAIEAMKVGATDYVFKTKLSRIVPSLRRALREADEKVRRAKAEAALRAAESELAHIARITTMGELVGSIAHEIRQPLAAAVMSAHACMRWLLQSMPEIAEARAAAALVIAETQRAAEIVDRVRTLYARGVPRRETVDIGGIIREIVALLEDQASRHAVRIETRLGAPDVRTTGDRIQLLQVMLNLMLNAIDAMSDTGGELTVSSAADDAHMTISVSDTGGGIPADQLERIFHPFVTTKPHGTGMGLSVSRRIVEAHGGRLWASSCNGTGATFHFTLPSD